MQRRHLLRLAALSGLALERSATESRAAGPVTAWVITTEGKTVEGTLAAGSLSLETAGRARRLDPGEVLSVHSARPASPSEERRIQAGLAAAAGEDRAAREAALADLTEIGLPVLTPLLASYKDTDAREPAPLYRLFGRIMPGHGDALDRSLDLVRLPNGEALRGKLSGTDLKLAVSGGGTETVPLASVRRIAFRRPKVERTLDLQALHHCTYIAWLDTGVGVTPATKLTSRAAGLVRLDFNEDGWATGPDGLEKPLPGKRLKQEGFLWGTLLGRVGPAGERWIAGTRLEKTGLPFGRLYYVVNDNEHWQNNIGGYRAWLTATDAYDLGDPL